MTAFAIWVQFHVKEGTMDRFLEALDDDARHSMADEPACHQFRVLVPEDEKNTVYLFEVYDNEAALDTHRNTPHYARFSKAVEELGAERGKILKLALQNP